MNEITRTLGEISFLTSRPPIRLAGAVSLSGRPSPIIVRVTGGPVALKHQSDSDFGTARNPFDCAK
jgi:hypothetical protein